MTSDLNDEFCKDHSGFCVENLLESLLFFFSKSALANEMITKIFKKSPTNAPGRASLCIILLARMCVCTGTHTHTTEEQAGQYAAVHGRNSLLGPCSASVLFLEEKT